MNRPRSKATQPWYESASTRDVMSINMADGNNFRATPEEANTFLIPIAMEMGNHRNNIYV